MIDNRNATGCNHCLNVIAKKNGVFGCLGMMACHDVCSKELPLLEVYAYLRRRALAAGLRRSTVDAASDARS